MTSAEFGDNMRFYVDEQVVHLRRLLDADPLAQWQPDTPVFDAIVFVAVGSSYNAAYTVAGLFRRLLDLPVHCMRPVEFFGRCDTIGGRVLCVCISQTGTSTVVVRALRRAQDLGWGTLGVSQEGTSPVATEAEFWLDLHSGQEDSNAKTKGFSCTLLALQLLALHLAVDHGVLDRSASDEHVHALRAVVDGMPELIERSRTWVNAHVTWKDAPYVVCVGADATYGLAMEASLKLLETLLVPCVATELEEFSHGYHRMITPQSHVLVLDEQGDEAGPAAILSRFLADLGSPVLLVTLHQQPPAGLRVQSTQLFGAVNQLAVVIQVLASELPYLNGQNPNRPANVEVTELLGARAIP